MVELHDNLGNRKVAGELSDGTPFDLVLDDGTYFSSYEFRETLKDTGEFEELEEAVAAEGFDLEFR